MPSSHIRCKDNATTVAGAWGAGPRIITSALLSRVSPFRGFSIARPGEADSRITRTGRLAAGGIIEMEALEIGEIDVLMDLFYHQPSLRATKEFTGDRDRVASN
jgi:hypothetical protein